MTKKTKTKKQKGYEPQYLLLALVVFLLIEGFLVSNATNTDWQKGLSVLDVSSAVSRIGVDVQIAIAPMIDTVKSVDEFYQLSAAAMTELLDLSSRNPMDEVLAITDSINEFYQRAANEMIALLDVTSYQPNVAGAYTSPY